MEDKERRETVWAVIPARGGSKGVRKKNIRKLNGKPLICHSIEALKASESFEKIIVTSDDSEILECAFHEGVTPYERTDPVESNDFTMPDLPTLSALYSFDQSVRPEFTFMVQCTTPFVRSETYVRAVKSLINEATITVFAAVESHSFLWRRVVSPTDELSWVPINHPFHERLGRQFKTELQIAEVGAFYGFPTENFLRSRHRFFSSAMPILLDESEAIDIDSEVDFRLAEQMIAMYGGRSDCD